MGSPSMDKSVTEVPTSLERIFGDLETDFKDNDTLDDPAKVDLLTYGGINRWDPYYLEKVLLYRKYILDGAQNLKQQAFTLKNIGSYSLAVQLGGGTKNFGNGEGQDHGGFLWRISLGLKNSFGPLLLDHFFLRGFFEQQYLSKSLNPSTDSRARVDYWGLEAKYLMEVLPAWFYLGPSFATGAVTYRSQGKGMQFNKNADLQALTSTGMRLEPGAELCTWGMKLCGGFRYAWDVGLHQGATAVFNPSGISFFAGVDILRFWDPENFATFMSDYDEQMEKLDQKTLTKVQEIKSRGSETAILQDIETRPETFFDFRILPSQFYAEEYGDEKQVLGSLLQKAPQVLMFGEIHRPEGYSQPSTAALFALRIMPSLPKDYRDLVFEMLPHDIPESELDWFYEHGTLGRNETPYLWRWARIFQHSDIGFLAILEQARVLDIRIHGAGPSLKDWISVELANNSTAHARRLEKEVGLITRVSREEVQRLLREGKKVITYNGSEHNNILPTYRHDIDFEVTAFGDDLAKGHSVLELDIVVPGILTNHIFQSSNPRSLYHPLLRMVTPYLPPRGKVNLVHREGSSYTLVYPFLPENP